MVALVLLTPVFSPLSGPSELNNSEPLMAQEEIELKMYTLYLASQNTSAGGDGYITTEVPESGGQDSASALDTEIDFRSSDMMSSLVIHGRSQHGSSGSYYVPLDLFLRATGPNGATVDLSLIHI